jgi:hypothetical protein
LGDRNRNTASSFFAQRVARRAEPSGRQRQDLDVFLHDQRHKADPCDLQARRPARNDCEADVGSYETDNGLLVLGDLRYGRTEARPLEQLDRQVVTVRPRAAFRDDRGLINERVEQQAVAIGKLVPGGHCDDRRLVKQHLKLDALIDARRGANEREFQPPRKHPRQEADRLVFDELDGDVGMMLAEIVQKIGEQSGGSGIDGAPGPVKGGSRVLGMTSQNPVPLV